MNDKTTAATKRKSMKRIGRRSFLKYAATGAVALDLSRLGSAASAQSTRAPVSDDVRLAIIGIGSKEAIGGVGGRGRQLISALQKVHGARIVALCDVDEGIVARQASELKERGQPPVTLYRDLRRVFDDKGVDAVVVATPNHWHALATVWACQAGKDVYVEKPVSHKHLGRPADGGGCAKIWAHHTDRNTSTLELRNAGGVRIDSTR
jgi:hypothetical protein